MLKRLEAEALAVSELTAPISLQAVSRHIQVLVRASSPPPSGSIVAFFTSRSSLSCTPPSPGRCGSPRREADGIKRLSDVRLGPGDDFCSLWHFFDLLPEGRGDWLAKYRYA